MSKIDKALNSYRQKETQYNIHKEQIVKLLNRFNELSITEADQKQIIEAARIAAEEMAAKCGAGDASMDDLKPLTARQADAESNLHETQLVLNSIKKGLEKLNAEYGPAIHPMAAAKETLFLEMADILRGELLSNTRLLPLIHEIYACRIVSDGRVMPWPTFVVNVLDLSPPTREQTAKHLEKFEGMIAPDESQSEQSTAGSIQDRQQSNGAGVIKVASSANDLALDTMKKAAGDLPVSAAVDFIKNSTAAVVEAQED